MNLLQEATIGCPYCGESISILVDTSIESQQYIEDCQVCCRPIELHLQVAENGEYRVDAQDEDFC